ncbi:LAFE_0B08020g1_1 [Lachancea fermentati]|uniref:LAFE_0B08020g1_1 n=1 Tax=Lachancea fermentati TaxID=4955 RepID=A0A1G4M895_LACFM|nr:LAFE_0B08020g1_1 [Lachancea fermentati]
MSQKQQDSCDTSCSSGTSTEQIALPPKRRNRTSSYFKEAFSPAVNASTNSFSVYFDDSKLAYHSNSDSSNGDNTIESISIERENDLQKPQMSKENLKLSAPEPKTNNRSIVLRKSSEVLQESNPSSSSSSHISTPIVASSSTFISESESSSRNSCMLRNTSVETVNTNALIQSRPTSTPFGQHEPNTTNSNSTHVPTTNAISERTRNVSGAGLDENSQRVSSLTGGESQRTVSTYLIRSSDIIQRNTSDSNSVNRPISLSSNLLPEAPTNDPQIINSQNVIEEENDETSYASHSLINTAIEEAAELFKREATTPQPVQLIQSPLSRIIPPQRSQASLRSNQSSRYSELSQTRRMTRGIQHPSLLANILIPANKSPQKASKDTLRKNNLLNHESSTAPVIPALRKISGSSRIQKHVSSDEKEQQHAKEIPKQSLQSPEEIQKPVRLPLRISQDTMEHIYEYRALLHEFDHEKHLVAVQHVDSASVSSHDSNIGKFMDVFSISRIVMVLMICIVAPPLYFMLGAGPKGGITDKRLMNLIMTKEFRVGLFAGFVWDVDVSWFRHLCLILGCFEILAICACIGVGFGVGISRE